METPQDKQDCVVREQVRMVVGDLENVLGELKTMVGDIKVLVNQIDRVTTKIDEKYQDEPERRRLSTSVLETASSRRGKEGTQHRFVRHSWSQNFDTSLYPPTFVDGNRLLASPLPNRNDDLIISRPYLGLADNRSDSFRHDHHSEHRNGNSQHQKTSVCDNFKSSSPVCKSPSARLPEYSSGCHQQTCGADSGNSSSSRGFPVSNRFTFPESDRIIKSLDNNCCQSQGSSSRKRKQRPKEKTQCDTLHSHCSPCSPISDTDYCGVYEREMDEKLEECLESDEGNLSDYNDDGFEEEDECRTIDSFKWRNASNCIDDINLWTSYTMDIVHDNPFDYLDGACDDSMTDASSDILNDSFVSPLGTPESDLIGSLSSLEIT